MIELTQSWQSIIQLKLIRGDRRQGPADTQQGPELCNEQSTLDIVALHSMNSENLHCSAKFSVQNQSFSVKKDVQKYLIDQKHAM